MIDGNILYDLPIRRLRQVLKAELAGGMRLWLESGFRP
jgi:hypothetical protein